MPATITAQAWAICVAIRRFQPNPTPRPTGVVRAALKLIYLALLNAVPRATLHATAVAERDHMLPGVCRCDRQRLMDDMSA
jgi:hypothetical protein